MTNNTTRTNDILRATGLIIVEVRNSNPNGDPERDGAPRKRRGDIGEISPVSVKRKIRDLVANKKGPIWLYLKKKFDISDDNRFDILEERGRDRADIKKMILENGGKTFIDRFWDARVFGNTFLEKTEKGPKESASGNTKEASKEKIKEAIVLKESVKTGVVHFGLGLSVAPVTSRTDFTLTNKSSVEQEKTSGMAPGAYKFIEHGIYAIPFFVNPTQASKTGCSKTDVDIVLELIPYVYSHNRSLIRTQVEVLHAYYAEHKNQKGSYNDFDLLDALTPKKKEAKDKPSSERSEYTIPNRKDHPDIFKQFEDRVTIRDLMDLMRE
jgi:Cas7 group CRISPR-associated protein Csh2